MSDSPGNPFTNFLKKGRNDAALERFIARWDDVERLLIDTYKAGEPPDGAVAAWQALQTGLLDAYERVADRLKPYWKAATVNHAPVPEDPFLAIIRMPTPEAVIDNWALFQLLPPAREAVNRALLQ